MSKRPAASLVEHFAGVEDPRRREGVYPLINFLVIGVCAVICGVDDFVSMAEPAEFERCLLNWITALHEVTAGKCKRVRTINCKP